MLVIARFHLHPKYFYTFRRIKYLLLVNRRSCDSTLLQIKIVPLPDRVWSRIRSNYLNASWISFAYLLFRVLLHYIQNLYVNSGLSDIWILIEGEDRVFSMLLWNVVWSLVFLLGRVTHCLWLTFVFHTVPCFPWKLTNGESVPQSWVNKIDVFGCSSLGPKNASRKWLEILKDMATDHEQSRSGCH